MAEMLAFPPARRVAYVRRQAEFVLGLSREAGERHIARQVALQHGTLVAKGVDTETADRLCADLDAALRAALWRSRYEPHGAA